MSHSKQTKRDYSLYIEKWNPSAKKYLNICAICGHKGYSPAIEQADFCNDSNNRVIYEELSKTHRKMQIDELGRCEVCAKIQSIFESSRNLT